MSFEIREKPEMVERALLVGLGMPGDSRRERTALLAELEFPRPWILSARMDAAQLEHALELCRPDGVDFDSCVEAAPGIKSPHRLLQAIFRRAQQRLGVQKGGDGLNVSAACAEDLLPQAAQIVVAQVGLLTVENIQVFRLSLLDIRFQQ